MRNASDHSYRWKNRITAFSLSVLFAAGGVGLASANDGVDVSADTFIPMVPGFEMPVEEEELVDLPPPGEEVSLERFKEDYSKLKEAVSKRLGDLSVRKTFDEEGEYEGLPSVDTSSYTSDLDEQAAIRREIDLLTLRVEQAKLAKDLWNTLFGDEEKKRQEEEKERALMAVRGGVMHDGQWYMSDQVADSTQIAGQREVEEKVDEGPVKMLTTSDGWTLYSDSQGQVYFARAQDDGSPDFTTIKSVEDVMIMRETEAAIAAEERLRAEQAQAALDEEITQQQVIDRLPAVVSVSGVGESLRARLNDRVYGLIDVSRGDTLPNGIGVAKITTTGVTFSTKSGKTHHIGVGVTGILEN